MPLVKEERSGVFSRGTAVEAYSARATFDAFKTNVRKRAVRAISLPLLLHDDIA
jgi:hypothetical protein